MIGFIETKDGKVLIDKAGAAKIAGVARPSIYRWISNGLLPVVTVGSVELVDREDVLHAAKSLLRRGPQRGGRPRRSGGANDSNGKR